MIFELQTISFANINFFFDKKSFLVSDFTDNRFNLIDINIITISNANYFFHSQIKAVFEQILNNTNFEINYFQAIILNSIPKF